MIRMPYKNIEDRRAAYRRWYWSNYPESKDHIIKQNKKWKTKNRDRHLEHQRKSGKKRREEKKEQGRCPRCGAIIEDDERILNNGQTLCDACKTIGREHQRARKRGGKFHRVV